MIDHPVIQTVFATATLSTIIGWLPVIVGVPGAIYYCILIYEKFKKED
jgi:hypothetical protein